MAYPSHLRRPFDADLHFWPHVDIRGPDECWPWTRGAQGDGYGILRVDGRHQLAHRVAYQDSLGAIPAGLELDHLCRNRRCCNPAHLEAVTTGENQRRGLNTKLTAEQVHVIRASTEPSVRLAERYGVSWGLIGHIRHGRAWKGV